MSSIFTRPKILHLTRIYYHESAFWKLFAKICISQWIVREYFVRIKFCDSTILRYLARTNFLWVKKSNKYLLYWICLIWSRHPTYCDCMYREVSGVTWIKGHFIGKSQGSPSDWTLTVLSAYGENYNRLFPENYNR